MAKQNYSQKLRDPRWQKKRLEIMSRDEFTCRICGDNESTLNVHHFTYSGEPWDVDSGKLLTICEPCHEREHKERSNSEVEMLKVLKSMNTFSFDIEQLSEALSSLKMIGFDDVSGVNGAPLHPHNIFYRLNLLFKNKVLLESALQLAEQRGRNDGKNVNN